MYIFGDSFTLKVVSKRIKGSGIIIIPYVISTNVLHVSDNDSLYSLSLNTKKDIEHLINQEKRNVTNI